MKVTLEDKMNRIFAHGLEMINESKEPIVSEWVQTLKNLEDVGKKSHQVGLNIFSFYQAMLFDVKAEKKEYLIMIKEKWERDVGFSLANQRIVLLFELAVERNTKAKLTNDYLSFQSIKYVLSSINKVINSSSTTKQFTTNYFLTHLTEARQLPIEWIISSKHNEGFYVENVYGVKEELEKQLRHLEAATLFELNELINKKMNVEMKILEKSIMLPFEDMSLIIGLEASTSEDIIPFIHYIFHLFKQGKSVFNEAFFEAQWKDPVILFHDFVMLASTFEKTVKHITEGFVKLLPFERAALFSYSTKERKSFGLAGYELDSEAIKKVEEHLNNLPIIKDGIDLLTLFSKESTSFQPIYLSDAKHTFSKEYIDTFKMKSLVIAPIYTDCHGLIGAVLLDQGENQLFSISSETREALTKFGQTAGESLAKYNLIDYGLYEAIPTFSPREIEVLNLMSEGLSTIESARELNLSEYTVRDYVSAIMKKMNANNRTEAVARAIRKGII